MFISDLTKILSPLWKKSHNQKGLFKLLWLNRASIFIIYRKEMDDEGAIYKKRKSRLNSSLLQIDSAKIVDATIYFAFIDQLKCFFNKVCKISISTYNFLVSCINCSNDNKAAGSEIYHHSER